ncbi:hypothetical protein PSECIP111854_04164 [Pseudoalteromonas sp. CIP111854]|uniref:Uncharacterized protein n=1 Tax=Pseudoalteromonas holothuriae TaxID=2963714 RepID=A0A9W4W7Z9_9GAMM|nr:hypothetical protein PSECIP111854_04164 [Pseudoalteromonas sp. CIP111854]
MPLDDQSWGEYADPEDIKLLGIYSDKLNYKIFPNYKESKLIRTDYQLRNCKGGGCSAPSTFLWDNH